MFIANCGAVAALLIGVRPSRCLTKDFAEVILVLGMEFPLDRIAGITIRANYGSQKQIERITTDTKQTWHSPICRFQTGKT